MYLFHKRSANEAAAGAEHVQIDVQSVRQGAPEFRRMYSAQVNQDVRIKIEIYTSFTGRAKWAELRQGDGRWVVFDPDRVAEKILDRAIVPLVQRHVDQIYTIDKEFIRSDPDEFTDKKGQKWKRFS